MKETRALGIEVGDFVSSLIPNHCDRYWPYQISSSRWQGESAAGFWIFCVYKEERIQLPVTTPLPLSVFEEGGTGLRVFQLEVVEYLAVIWGYGMTSWRMNTRYPSVSKIFRTISLRIRQYLVAFGKKPKKSLISWISILSMDQDASAAMSAGAEVKQFSRSRNQSSHSMWATHLDSSSNRAHGRCLPQERLSR